MPIMPACFIRLSAASRDVVSTVEQLQVLDPE
jgi:hypothetical protein